jgi:hypothetical protein
MQLELTKDDLRRIDEAAPKGTTAGMRYPPAVMEFVNR